MLHALHDAYYEVPWFDIKIPACNIILLCINYVSIWFYSTRKRGLSTTTNGGNRDSALSKIYTVLGKTTRATTCLYYAS